MKKTDLIMKKVIVNYQRGGSKKIRKRKRKSVKRNKQYGGKTSNKKVKKLRKRRFLSKRR